MCVTNLHLDNGKTEQEACEKQPGAKSFYIFFFLNLKYINFYLKISEYTNENENNGGKGKGKREREGKDEEKKKKDFIKYRRNLVQKHSVYLQNKRKIITELLT